MTGRISEERRQLAARRRRLDQAVAVLDGLLSELEQLNKRRTPVIPESALTRVQEQLQELPPDVGPVPVLSADVAEAMGVLFDLEDRVLALKTSESGRPPVQEGRS